MNIGDRVLIIGKSGSGKSILAQSLLLDFIRNNPECDVLIINHKNEKSLNKLLKPLKKVPKHFPIGTRVNIVPLYGDKEDDELLDNLLKEIYQNGDHKDHKGTIVLIDEGLMISPRNKWMTALYTQGRSKDISVITLSQRPVWISKFAITQSTYIHVYNVMGKDDITELERIVRPKNEKLEKYIDRIPSFNYLTYAENEKELIINEPVPFPVKGSIKPLKRRLSKKLLLLPLAGLLAYTMS